MSELSARGGRILVLKAGKDAIHKAGNIKRDVDDYIQVHAETDDEYIGNFVEGLGFIDVHFRKKDTRPLTHEEVEALNQKSFTINGQTMFRFILDEDGYYAGAR